jgi:hypothetical protein
MQFSIPFFFLKKILFAFLCWKLLDRYGWDTLMENLVDGTYVCINCMNVCLFFGHIQQKILSSKSE